MSRSSVIPFWPVARISQEHGLRPKPPSRCPPDHLHHAAKLAWNDIVCSQARGLHISNSELETAAVLLANRDGRMPTPLVAQLNAALAELGLSRFARARLRD